MLSTSIWPADDDTKCMFEDIVDWFLENEQQENGKVEAVREQQYVALS